MLPKDKEILNLLAKEDYEGAMTLYAFKYEVGEIQAKAVVQSYLSSHEEELKEQRKLIKESAHKNEKLELEVLTEINEGKLNKAVQLYQQHYGCSIQEAQMSVEQIRREHFPDFSSLSLRDQLLSRRYWMVAIGLVLLLLLFKYIY